MAHGTHYTPGLLPYVSANAPTFGLAHIVFRNVAPHPDPLLLPALLPASLSEVNGAKVWIRVAGFSIQPSEVAKLALMVFFAGYLVGKRDLLSLASRRVLGLDPVSYTHLTL